MNHKSFPAQAYTLQIGELNQQLVILKTTKDRIAWARLAIILLLLLTAFYLYPISVLYTTITVGLLLGLFIRLVILAVNNKASIENANRLVAINEQEIKIVQGIYTHLPDGANLISVAHYYANDLDIFGRASLYQYINRTTSQQGNATFANWLLNNATAAQIAERQEAAKELAPQFTWRQQLQAYGIEQAITTETEQKVTNWVQQSNKFSTKLSWKIAKWAYPAFTLSLLFLFLTDVIPSVWFYGGYAVFFIVSSQVRKIIFPEYVSLNKIVPEINTLVKSAACIEGNIFFSNYLLQLQKNFLHNGNVSSLAIKKIKNILDKFDDNLNLVLVFVLNPFLLWDLQLIFKLEKWRTDNKTQAPQWFNALGQIEAIASIANLSFNHPQWTFPTIDTAAHGTFTATELGHPLIPEDKIVYNDFSTQGVAQVALITGSNMAGKSTFLRSVGVNTVLAMMGAPVCAKQMKVSPMRIISSMRVADNLEESTSTFYAELKKLQFIIGCVNNNEKVFVLLDEILRGTNSLDRHTGSKALVKQLIKKNAVAILATHDVELAQLKNDYASNINNYHFDAQIDNEELYFDYKLKHGICKSINASILMKKIGIEL